MYAVASRRHGVGIDPYQPPPARPPQVALQVAFVALAAGGAGLLWYLTRSPRTAPVRNRRRRGGRRVRRNTKSYPYLLDEAADLLGMAKARLSEGLVEDAYRLTQQAESTLGRATAAESGADPDDLARSRRLGWHLADLYGEIAKRRRRVSRNASKRAKKGRKYPLCKPYGRHGGRPFTCRACGGKACWNCALHYWREKALPHSDGDLHAQWAAIDAAERDGLLLGVCSDKCRAKLPRGYDAKFRLTENAANRARTSRRVRRNTKKSGFSELGTFDAVGIVRRAAPREQLGFMAPGLVKMLRDMPPGIYKYGHGPKRGQVITKFTKASLRGALTSTRIGARSTGEHHWVIDNYDPSYPVVIRIIDSDGRSVFRVERYAQTLAGEKVAVARRSKARRSSVKRNPVPGPPGDNTHLPQWVRRTYADGTSVRLRKPLQGYSSSMYGFVEVPAGAKGRVVFAGDHHDEHGNPRWTMEGAEITVAPYPSYQVPGDAWVSVPWTEAWETLEPLDDNWGSLTAAPMKSYQLPASQRGRRWP